MTYIPGIEIEGTSGNRMDVTSDSAAFVSLTGAGGTHQIVDQNGAVKVGEAIVLAGDVWGGILPNTIQWDTEIIGGSGAFTAQAGNLNIATGVNTASSIRLDSVKKARFMGSQFNIFHTGLQMHDLTDPDTTYRFGAFNAIGSSNGGYFAAQGHATDPVWNLCTVKNGVTSSVPQASWTGPDKDKFNPLPNLSVYEIAYNAGSLYFFQGRNLLHIQAVNKLGHTYANTYHFNVGIEVTNGGGVNDSSLDVYANVIYRLGEERGEVISRTFELGNGNQLIKTGAGYCKHMNLATAGNSNSEATVEVYDGIDATGIRMGYVSVAGNDSKGFPIDSTYSTGLFVVMTSNGAGTKVATIGFE